MSKRLIAIDLDDVLADATEFWRLEVNRRTNLKLTKENYKIPGDYWRYYEHVWRTHKIDHLISFPDLDAQIINDQSGIAAYANSLVVLEKLKESFDLVVVTARNGDQRPESERWLEQNFPGMFSYVHFADGPKGIATKNKGQICKEISAGWLIDDNPNHCRDALNNGVNAILFGEYGWHKDIPEKAVKCPNWFAVEKYFDEQ